MRRHDRTLGSTQREASKTDICSSMHQNKCPSSPSHSSGPGFTPGRPATRRYPGALQSTTSEEKANGQAALGPTSAALRHGSPLTASRQGTAGTGTSGPGGLPLPHPPQAGSFPLSPPTAYLPPLADVHPFTLPSSPGSRPSAPGSALSCPPSAPRLPQRHLSRLLPGFSSGRSFTEGGGACAAAPLFPLLLARSAGPVSWRRRRRSRRWISKGTRRPCPGRRCRGE